jgi:multidrug efflux pump subunit AcrB
VRDAEALRQQLLHVPGVKKVNIIGEQPERIFVSFSHDRLATLGVTPQDIFAALNSQNVLTPAGSIETKGRRSFARRWRVRQLEKIGRPRSWPGTHAEIVGCGHRRAWL